MLKPCLVLRLYVMVMTLYVTGFFAGGLVCRGILEQFSDPKVKTFISLSSPHAGQFGGELHIRPQAVTCYADYNLRRSHAMLTIYNLRWSHAMLTIYNLRWSHAILRNLKVDKIAQTHLDPTTHAVFLFTLCKKIASQASTSAFDTCSKKSEFS